MERKLTFVCVLAGMAAFGSAQQIATRTQLNSILANGYEYEDAFEAYPVTNGTEASTGLFELDSTSMIGSAGPGLVDPGVKYVTDGASSYDQIYWDGLGYYGAPSEDILAGGTFLALDYTLNVNAMGVDLRAFTGFGDGFTATVYNGANVVGSYTGTLANNGSTQFFGWYNSAGITSVVLAGDGVYNWTPIIDNHSFGYTPVPEPASLAALAIGGLGLLRRRRRA